MKLIVEFPIGSSVFFSNYEDYTAKDNDKLCIMDNFPIKDTNVLNLKQNGDDV